MSPPAARAVFRPNWGKLVPFVIIHVGTVVAAVSAPPTRGLLALAFGLYLVRMLATTLGYHRYFSHRSFKTSRAMQFALAVFANLTLMRGPIQWAAHHRHHHKWSDTEKDLHSPKHYGFWMSHVGWFLSRNLDDTHLMPTRDLQKFPELVWIDRFYFLPAYSLGAALWIFGGWPAFVWGFLVSTVFNWHAVFTINSLSHIFGATEFATTDTSKNNAALAMLTLGEGWHNNHHHEMQAARHGRAWWQIDVTYYVIWTLEKVGLVWDVRQPSDVAEDEDVTPDASEALPDTN